MLGSGIWFRGSLLLVLIVLFLVAGVRVLASVVGFLLALVIAFLVLVHRFSPTFAFSAVNLLVRVDAST